MAIDFAILLPRESGRAGAAGKAARADRPFPKAPPPEPTNPYVVRYLLAEGRFLYGQLDELENTVFIRIPREQPAMAAVVRRELTAAYIAHGQAGVRQFAAGVMDLAVYTRLVRNNQIGQKRPQGVASGKELFEIMGRAVPAERRPLWDCFESERAALGARIQDCLRRIGEQAKVLAVQRLQQCRALVLAEAVRYLDFSGARAARLKPMLGGLPGDRRVQLDGPDGPALLAELRAIQPAYRALQQVQSDYLKARGIDAAGQAGSARVVTAMLPALAALARLAAQAVPGDTLTMLRRDAAQQADDFKTRFHRAAMLYPILFRIVEEEPVSDRDAALAVSEALQDAYQACTALEADLESTDALWRLPMLIDLTLQNAFAAEADFAGRVAADHFRSLEGEIHPFEGINYFVQSIDTALMLVPFPPLELGMLVLSVLAEAGQLAEQYVREGVKRRAAKAALDPSLALSDAPSLLALAFQAVFLALCVIPVPGMLKKARESRQASSAL